MCISFTVVRTLSAITSSLLSIRLDIVKPDHDNTQRTLGIHVATVNAVLTTISSGSRSIIIIVPLHEDELAILGCGLIELECQQCLTPNM